MKTFIQTCMAAIFCLILQNCKKDNSTGGGGGGNNNNTDTTTTITPPTEPAIASTQGFFLDNWQAKTWATPEKTIAATKPSTALAVNITVDLSQEITKVSNYIYGNNANPFMGNISTDATLIQNIKNLS